MKAKHHFLIYPFFKWYAYFIVNRNFGRPVIEFQGSVNEKAILVISNHVSWWDGFWIMYLNLKVLHKKFHFMMLKEQLKKHWYFNYSGGFSVEKNSKSILQSLDYAAELLSDRQNLVLIFPQGKISSIHRQHFEFEKGVEKIIAKAQPTPTILFTVNLTDYFSKPKPTLFIYTEEFKDTDISIRKLEQTYNEFFQQCVEKQKLREEK